MADETDTGETAMPQPNGEDTAPSAGVLSQYVKDFSFENPNSPGIYQQSESPQLDVQFNIGASRLGDDVHEVILKIEVRAEVGGHVAFVIDLAYAGLFALRNIPDDHLQPFLLGEAPRILFPFARRVLADAVRDGGFQPLLLEPIDFGQLYLQQLEAGGAPLTADGETAGQA